MPVVTIPNIALTFELTVDALPVDYACQILDAEITLPGATQGTRIETACPDGAVVEAGGTTNGAITGNAFADGQDDGITWALATLYQTHVEFPYSVTWWSDQAATIAITFSGLAVVNSFKLPFSKPGKARQPIDLGLVTAVMSRPIAA